jgi:hypothetical protein
MSSLALAAGYGATAPLEYGVFDAMGRRILAPKDRLQQQADAEGGLPSKHEAVGDWSIASLLPPSLPLSSFLTLALLLASSAGYRVLEPSWSAIDALYASTGVLTTVGIVLAPTSTASRAFTALLNVVSLGLGVALVTDVRNYRASSARSLLGLTAVRDGPALALMLDALLACGTVGAGAVGFHVLEGWPLHTSLYFALTCSTGLGMDHIAPATQGGRLFFLLFEWAVLGVAVNALANGSMMLVGRLAPRRRGRGQGAGGQK